MALRIKHPSTPLPDQEPKKSTQKEYLNLVPKYAILVILKQVKVLS